MAQKHWTDTHNYTDTQKNWKNGELLNSTSNNYSRTSQLDSVTLNVPNWKRAIALGNNATGEMDASWDRTRMTQWFGGVSYTLKSDPKPNKDRYEDQRLSGSGLTGNLPTYSSGFATADSQARSRAFKAAVGTRRSLQGGVILAELRETMAMLKRPMKQLETSCRNLLETYRRATRQAARRGSREKKVRAVNDAIRGTWLEVTYGWAPLISDTRQAAEVLAEKHLHLSREVDFVRSVGEAFSASVTTARQSLGQYQYYLNTVRERVDRVKILAALRSYTPSPLKRTMSDLGFSPEEFIPTVWELIPYSFVIDYFTNTGEVLDAWSHRSIAYHWCQKTTILEQKVSVNQVDNTYNYQTAGLEHQDVSVTFVPGSFKRSAGRITRLNVDMSEIQPEFHFEIPGIRQTANVAFLTDSFRRLSSTILGLLKK